VRHSKATPNFAALTQAPKPLRLIVLILAIWSSHADSLAPEVRVSTHRPEQKLPCNNRTLAAKAVHAQEVYGTAEAVRTDQAVENLTRTSPVSTRPWQPKQTGAERGAPSTAHGH
jgi:hypothetical protein